MKICGNSHKLQEIIPKSGFYTLVVSDIHFDSPHCDRELFKEHLDEALVKKANVFIIGDLFDVMGCKHDPRSLPNQVRPEYLVKGRSYLDLVVHDLYQFLKPYRKIIKLISYGNHETAILKHNETDPLDRLVYLLNQEGHHTFKGGYSGFITYQFKQSKRKASIDTTIAYHHGSGGNAKRSKGILDADLDMAMYPDADIILKGHNHNSYLYEGSRVRLDRNYQPYQCNQYHVRLGSYKNEYGTGEGGWAIEKGFGPQPRGGWWLKHTWVRRRVEGVQKELLNVDIYSA